MGLFSRATLTDAQKEKLRMYSYAGSDASYLLRLYRPVLEWAVEQVGLLVSPNLITLGGFACVNSAAIATLAVCPTLREPMPQWLYFWNGTTIWLYQWLDNLDGKQARRTMTSSAFGELFDHGVDAYASTAAAICFIAALQLGITTLSLLTPFLIYFPFFFATWEQYWLGRMDLGPINGAMEGIFSLVLVMYVGGVMGGEVYQQKIAGLRVGEAAGVMGTGLALFCVLYNMKAVARGVAKEGTVLAPVKQIVPLLTLLATGVVCTYGDDDLEADSLGLGIILVNGLLFGEMGTDLTLSHLSGIPFRTFFPTLLVPVVLAVNRLSLLYFNVAFPQGPLTWFAVGLLLIYTIIYKAMLINSITRALKINFITLTEEQKAKLLRPVSPDIDL